MSLLDGELGLRVDEEHATEPVTAGENVGRGIRHHGSEPAVWQVDLQSGPDLEAESERDGVCISSRANSELEAQGGDEVQRRLTEESIPVVHDIKAVD